MDMGENEYSSLMNELRRGISSQIQVIFILSMSFVNISIIFLSDFIHFLEEGTGLSLKRKLFLLRKLSSLLRMVFLTSE
jgi:hypothetical protein